METVSGTAEGLEEKMKKATCEMLTLFLFARHEMYVNEVATELEHLSNGAFSIVFPYAIVYRMERQEYIRLKNKHVAEDGRLRQFYEITDKGRAYLTELEACYDKMTKGIADILHSDEGEK